jgi:hypothetical protein
VKWIFFSLDGVGLGDGFVETPNSVSTSATVVHPF